MTKSRFAALLALAFTAGIFLTTSSPALRFMSMTICNAVSVLMLAVLVLDFGISKRIALSGNPILGPLMLALLWAAVSLAISRLNPATVVPVEAYSYAWTGGLNAPELRGWSFVIRLALATASVHCIYRAVSTPQAFALVVRTFSWAYILFCTATLAQLLAYHLFNLPLGEIFVNERGELRIGSYVGEPSVLAGILASGYFLFWPRRGLSAGWPVLPTFFRWYGLFASSVCLLYAMSASVMAALALTILLSGSDRWKKIGLATFGSIILLVLQAFYSVSFESAIVSKIFHELTTVNIRTLSWLVGLDMWKASPWTGVGLGQSPFFNALYLPMNVDIPFDVRIYYDYTAIRHPPMNMYIEWTAETGLIGLAILCVAIYRVYSFQRTKTGPSTSMVRSTFGASLMTLLIAANTIPDAFYLPHLAFVLAMYLAGLKVFGQSSTLGTPRATVPVMTV